MSSIIFYKKKKKKNKKNVFTIHSFQDRISNNLRLYFDFAGFAFENLTKDFDFIKRCKQSDSRSDAIDLNCIDSIFQKIDHIACIKWFFINPYFLKMIQISKKSETFAKFIILLIFFKFIPNQKIPNLKISSNMKPLTKIMSIIPRLLT